jgi:hypothetical protein
MEKIIWKTLHEYLNSRGYISFRQIGRGNKGEESGNGFEQRLREKGIRFVCVPGEEVKDAERVAKGECYVVYVHRKDVKKIY